MAAWELFDPDDDVRITAGRLPHWFQPGRLYFVTFRCNDSLPAQVAELWYRRREDWLRRQGIDPRAADWTVQLGALPAAFQRQFHGSFSREFLESLDRGCGRCPLARPDLAAVVSEALLHFQGTRYEITDFVVMPNHVHVLVGLLDETDIVRQTASWKKNTALRINSLLGRTGRFWHGESFDHLVRTPAQFETLQRYVAANPSRAGLRPGEFLLWNRPRS